MLEILGTILNFFLIFSITVAWIRKRDILKIITVSLIIFYSEYVLFSCIFLSLDIFSVSKCLISQTILNGVGFFTSYKRFVDAIHKIEVNWKEIFFVFLGVAISLTLCYDKSESIYTHGDEGAYFNKALTLIQEDSSYRRNLQEFGKTTQKADEALIKLQNNQYAFNQVTVDKENGIFIYEHHALPVWPAILAHFMSLFGIFSAGYALNFVFLIAILAGYQILKVINKNSYTAYLIFPIFAFLPLGLYLAKSFLSEMSYIALLFSAVYFLVESKYREESFLFSAVILGLCGFLHISVLMYMPFWVIIFFITSILKKSYIFGVGNIIIAVMYLLSLKFAYHLSGIYTEDILENTIGLKLLPVLLGCYVLAILLQLLVIVLIKKGRLESLSQTTNYIISQYSIWLLRIGFICIGIYTLYQGYLLGYTNVYYPETMDAGSSWSARALYVNQGLMSALRLNLVSIIMGCSFICLPFVLFILYRKKIKIGYDAIAAYYLLLVGLSIYTFIQPDTPSNYYGSRYFITMIIPAVIYLTGEFASSKKTFRVIALVAIITALPFSLALFTMCGSKGTISMYQDIANSVGRESVVFIDAKNPYNTSLVNALRQINGSLVYEISSVDDVIPYYPDKNFFVILTDETVELPYDAKQYDEEIVLKKQYLIKGEMSDIKVVYPRVQNTTKVNLEVYKLTNEQLLYDFGQNENFVLKNFHQNEQEFRWSTGMSTIYATLNGNYSYYLKLYMPFLPNLNDLNRDVLSCTIRVNGVECTQFNLHRNDPTKEFEFYIDSEVLNEGLAQNEITIASETWQPSEYGSTDERYLGIPIDKIEFERVEEN